MSRRLKLIGDDYELDMLEPFDWDHTNPRDRGKIAPSGGWQMWLQSLALSDLPRPSSLAVLKDAMLSEISTHWNSVPSTTAPTPSILLTDNHRAGDRAGRGIGGHATGLLPRCVDCPLERFPRVEYKAVDGMDVFNQGTTMCKRWKQPLPDLTGRRITTIADSTHTRIRLDGPEVDIFAKNQAMELLSTSFHFSPTIERAIDEQVQMREIVDQLWLNIPPFQEYLPHSAMSDYWLNFQTYCVAIAHARDYPWEIPSDEDTVEQQANPEALRQYQQVMADQFNDYKEGVALAMLQMDAHRISRYWLYKRFLCQFPLRQADIVAQLDDVDKCIDFIKKRAAKRGWPVMCDGHERILKAREQWDTYIVDVAVLLLQTWERTTSFTGDWISGKYQAEIESHALGSADGVPLIPPASPQSEPESQPVPATERVAPSSPAPSAPVTPPIRRNEYKDHRANPNAREARSTRRDHEMDRSDEPVQSRSPRRTHRGGSTRPPWRTPQADQPGWLAMQEELDNVVTGERSPLFRRVGSPDAPRAVATRPSCQDTGAQAREAYYHSSAHSATGRDPPWTERDSHRHAAPPRWDNSASWDDHGSDQWASGDNSRWSWNRWQRGWDSAGSRPSRASDDDWGNPPWRR